MIGLSPIFEKLRTSPLKHLLLASVASVLATKVCKSIDFSMELSDFMVKVLILI